MVGTVYFALVALEGNICYLALPQLLGTMGSSGPKHLAPPQHIPQQEGLFLAPLSPPPQLIVHQAQAFVTTSRSPEDRALF